MWCSDQESTWQCRICKKHRFHPWVGKIPWIRKWQPTPVFLLEKSHGKKILVGYSPQEFPGDSDGKKSICNAGDTGWIPGSGTLPRGSRGNSPVFLLGEPMAEEPGGLQSMGLQRAGYDWATNKHTYYLKELREGTWLRERELLSETNFIRMTYLYGKENI